eukprot:TRINITY_DN10406_c0_g1_i1.p1 TRINITY_DN10406_c0_g1~~TRINITY_DN10406_c0_g1_i1.p1  ORF type:complete len:462 (-),score=133.54 TRINITY_DN10406_c0_g1_i1:113-1477(-)
MSTFAGNRALVDVDPEIRSLIDKEKERQLKGLELIASENFTSKAVMEALGSCLTNKYSEGLPGKRYYGGNEVIDKIENLAISRALEAFHLDPKEWGVNVQPYSGSVANLAAFNAVCEPHDKVMGLAISSGGHLSHGHQTQEKKISATSIIYNSIQYHVNQQTGLLEYDELDKLIQEHKPKLFIAGASAYPREWEYDKLRQSVDKVGGFLIADIAHISGLVAAGEQNDPFKYCHLVTTTTHKSLRGPRAGLIFYRKGKFTSNGKEYDLESKVNFSVFPSYQGGPHENQIGAIAVALKEVLSPDFKEYSKQVKSNAKALASALIKRGYKIQTDGTDNHLLLLHLREKDLTGSKLEKTCELAAITINKNMVIGDTSALAPSGVRLGTPALTSRGLKEADFEVVAGFIDEAVQIALKVQEKVGKKLADFNVEVEKNEDVVKLKHKVEEFAQKFPIPGL